MTLIDIGPGAAAILGAFVGSIGTFFAARSTTDRQLAIEKGALGQSLAAEIDSYCHIMDMRCHIENGERLVAYLNKQRQNPNKIAMAVMVRDKFLLTDEEIAEGPCPLFKASLDRLGILGPVCVDLAIFWNRIIAVRATIIAAMRGFHDPMMPGAAADLVRSELDVWKETIEMRPDLVKRLRNL